MVRQMSSHSRARLKAHDGPEISWEDGERVFRREQRPDAEGRPRNVLTVTLASAHPVSASLDRLAHEYTLRNDLCETWAVRPVSLIRERGRTVLLLEDPGCQPLDRLIDRQMEIGRYLRLAISLSNAIGRLHERGLIHKDIKPTNTFANGITGQVRLSGFGIASRVLRERQRPEPPEFIAGTLAYMSPEQTGRMNCSIDSRSDLYSLGVTLYELLTGELPFAASEPLEWVHCHIARKPTPPNERFENIPGPISAIVMKLLAKTAEQRYQTAAGVERDLRRCLVEWDTWGRINDFTLGECDRSDRLLIPEKLYGRAQEIQALLMSFDRIVGGSRPELILVSGYAGIGKSAVVNELHKSLVPPRGLFASGKFDQYKRDIPYATLAQAFQDLVRPLLSKSDTELSKWRDAINEAVGPNGALMVDLVPELEHVIGEQPPIPELPPQETQGRFQLVFRRFIGVFARSEHPLALFLDDLQWLDAATLDLLPELLTRPDLKNLMLIGAYRDSEVDSGHPLMRRIEAIRQAGGIVRDIVLAPLRPEDLGQLIADALRCERAHVIPLAQLIHDKTAGNAFFAIQFISALAEEGLLAFDPGNGRWSWDLSRILAKGYTDNVVELMVAKLNRLPSKTRNALQLLACLGNRAEFATWRMVFQGSDAAMHGQLWEAVRAGFVFRSDDSYIFLHDRVREAAYSLIANEARAKTHLRIGRLLAAHTPLGKRDEEIFEIVNQLNRGCGLIISAEECEQVAELNLVAARRAKTSTAYASALTYLAVSRNMLTEGSWADNYELSFAVELLTAECELLTGDMAAAETRLSSLMQRARTLHHIAVTTRLRVMLYTTLDRNGCAVNACLEYLRHSGKDWPPHPTIDDVRREYDRVWSLIGHRQIEGLIDLPLMGGPDHLDILDVLAELVWPAFFCEEAVSSLLTCRMVNLSLEYGNSDASCLAYVLFAIIAGPRFGNYEAGFRFGQLGYDLIEKRGLKRFQAPTYYSFGYSALPWTRHVRIGCDLLRRAFHAANEIGTVTSASMSMDNLIRTLLLAGDPLADVQREAESGLQYAEKVRFGRVVDHIKPQLGYVRTLRGLTRTFGCFDDDQFDELRFERYLADNPSFAEPECWYWIRKLQAQFFAGNYACAIAASSNVQRRFATSPSRFLLLDPVETAEFHFFSALAIAASWDASPPGERPARLEALITHHRRLVFCAENGPENFESRAALVGAEVARIEGRIPEAEQLYEQAIGSAHTNGFIHIEALGNELAAYSYAARGLGKIAQMYLREARDCYLQWGADGKVRQLENVFPHLRSRISSSDSTSTILTSVESLDLATVQKLSQAISGETELEKLFDTVMRTALEHAGAERGLLIIPRGHEHRIEAEATTTGEVVKVALRHANATAEDLPESVLRYVVRTNETVTLNDASGDSRFSQDEYVRRHQARSVLCLPLVKQARLVGVLYLENNLVRHVFTSARLTVLTLLASEAAISLENTRLLAEIRERELKVRRLVDSNIIGIFIFDHVPEIVEANQSFLRTVGYDRDDLKAGRLRWRELTPPEWQDRTARARAELKATKVVQPFEKEFFRRDGSRVPVLTGGALFEGGDEEQGVAFVLDLSERKQAEAEARENEHSYREAQKELAHANRLAAMGQLSASIAHEINQPIGATITYANAGLSWLRAKPPDLQEVQETFDFIIQSAVRAGEVIDRIRALVKKAPPLRDRLDINEAIREVLTLVRTEVARNTISVKTDLGDGLPPVFGDRVQLQQVMVNLILNAIEAMSGMGQNLRELLITTKSTGPEEVLVTVRDSGPGLPPESVERIFESFYTTKPGGLGMGLSICHSIIEAHEGTLRAAADLPQGAAFEFTLPTLVR